MDNSTGNFKLASGTLQLEGQWDFVYRPGAVLARKGTLTRAAMPIRPGKWYTWPLRALEADRFHLRRAILDGCCWLGAAGLPAVTQLLPDPGLGDLHVITDALLCCATSRRRGGQLLKVIPGSLRKAIGVTDLDAATQGLPVYCAGLQELRPVDLAEQETLGVNPRALAAWQGHARPRPFLAKLRMRDLLLPRIPGELTITFTGPARIWIRIPLPQITKTVTAGE